MKQKKNSSKTTSRFDALSLVHHLHDKYVRFVLQTRDVALQFIQFSVKQRIQEQIDFESLTLTEDSFIDTNLQQHFADVCYSGKLKTGKKSLFLHHNFEIKDFMWRFSGLLFFTSTAFLPQSIKK